MAGRILERNKDNLMGMGENGTVTQNFVACTFTVYLKWIGFSYVCGIMILIQNVLSHDFDCVGCCASKMKSGGNGG